MNQLSQGIFLVPGSVPLSPASVWPGHNLKINGFSWKRFLPDGRDKFLFSMASFSEQSPLRLRPFSTTLATRMTSCLYLYNLIQKCMFPVIDCTHLPTHCSRWDVFHLPPSTPKLHLGDHQSTSVLSSPVGALTPYLISEGQVQQQQQNFICSLSHPIVTPAPRRRQNPNLACQVSSPGTPSRSWGHGSDSNVLAKQA